MIGFIVRNYANITVTSWSALSEDELNDLYKQLLTMFDVDLACESMRFYVEATFRSSFCDFRTKLHNYYKAFPSSNEAKRHPHQDLTGERRALWNPLCELFESPRFKKRSAAGKIARDANNNLHRGGSRQFQTLAQRRAKERGQGKVNQVEIYKETHYNAKSGWIQNSESSYERMVDIQSRPVPEGSEPPTDKDIMRQVLGERRGYCKGMGFGPRPSKLSSRTSSQNSNLHVRLENAESELAFCKARLEDYDTQIEKMVEERMREYYEDFRLYVTQFSTCRQSSDESFSGPPPPSVL